MAFKPYDSDRTEIVNRGRHWILYGTAGIYSFLFVYFILINNTRE